MNKVTMSGNDGLWARIRAALGRPDAHVPAYGQAAIAQNPNKKPRHAQRIDDELRRGWTYCAERNVSLCVMTLEFDLYAAYFAAYGRESVEQALGALEGTVTPLLPRDSYRCLRHGRAGFVLVMPDMPALMARELASRIAAAIRQLGLVNRESHAGQVTMSTGIAVTNPQGKFERVVLEQANDAVKKAQRRGIARLEVVDLRGRDEKRRKAA
ncbi:diguanylate cyclase (GGDEF) domain-containing protein [Devosia lucknowensis]|uniref:Diguanylate cyclase (GGDEF) domain-containing protein n=1 Tax=Devosia lucknowensis TaxID=1096929 RepID=A0A1Y6EER6_9HYPH|nr:diguanylate cyclase [Devosia lucknowensis]SMQ61065.1 diguanylate cyclase (GGDEF) domain-containing protein [Devosia lucknowensis]